MTKNLQDELYQLEKNRGKGAKLRANIRSELEGKKCSKTFFKVLKKSKSAKIKQYLNYILMVINRHFQIWQKKTYERLYTKETISKAGTTQFLSKTQIERKYLMSNLIFVR